MRRCVYCTLKGRSRKESSTYCTHCRVYLCLNAKRNCFLEYDRDHHIQVEGEVLRFVVAFSHFNVLIIAHSLRETRKLSICLRKSAKKERGTWKKKMAALWRGREQTEAHCQVTIHPLSDQRLAAWRNHCNEEEIICLKKHQFSDEEVALAVLLLQRRRMAMERESTQKSKLHLSPNAVLNIWWLWQMWTYGIWPV